ncbi:MAG: aldehyde dehydrogenase family protein [Solirubrobacterales bacterium]
MDYKLLVGGEWVETGEWDEVLSPYDQSLVARVAQGDGGTVDAAAKAAHAAYGKADFPQNERAAVLDRAAELVRERRDDLAETIAKEAGKPIKTATVEAERAVDTLKFSATEARKLTGETIPMAASPAGVGKLALTLRIPYGVVGAISPFNFPLNLVAHKLGPAFAAGNAVVLKPAGQTPISAIKLAEVFLDAGLPEGWLSVVPGPGSSVGNSLVENPLIRAITFTGSVPVGWGIRSKVPEKKVNLELGSNAPLIVNEDGDWETAADKANIHAFSHAGQSCISTQRILLHEAIADEFIARLVGNLDSLVVGDPLSPETDVGPLISPAETERVEGWIQEAAAQGGTVVAGGELVDDGRCLAPTLIEHPTHDSKVWCEEIFGPVATIDRFPDFETGLAMANDSKFGLQAGVFTRDIGNGLKAANTLEFGGVLINEIPTFRADQQPYGGVKDSGNTREGPAYAVLELTEERMVSFQAG